MLVGVERLRQIGATRIPRRVRIVAGVVGVVVPVVLLLAGDTHDALIFLGAGAFAALGALSRRASR